MTRFKIVLLLILSLFACSKTKRPDYIPKNARTCGEYIISCQKVKKGLFYCEVYDSKNFTLVSKGNYISEYKKDNTKGKELSYRVVSYDGTTIFLKGGIKLIPSEIPNNAVRISSYYGSVWVGCKPVDKKNNRYYCHIYKEKDASLLSKGEYILKKFHYNKNRGKTVFESVKRNTPVGRLKHYNGITITTKNRFVLFPFGWIDYPSGDNFGKLIKYDKEGYIIDEDTYSF